MNANIFTNFKKPAKELFASRDDKEDVRIGDLLLPTRSTDPNSFVLLGYPDDLGIQLNHGRPGAHLAPDIIRNYLFRMTPPVRHSDLKLNDLGNLLIEEKSSLLERHQTASAAVTDLYKSNHRIISMGGGHDYGFPDGLGFLENFAANNDKSAAPPLIINFDAHLDVRPMTKDPHSGTPFRRLLSTPHSFRFVEVGLQRQCNSAHHAHWATENNAILLYEDDRIATGQSLKEQFISQLSLQDESLLLKRRKTFLSIDIDAFNSSQAPGASQSWPTGFSASDFFQLYWFCLSRFDVRGIGIYEVSPPLDVDGRTSRLAAKIIYDFLFQIH